jgi:AAA domain
MWHNKDLRQDPETRTTSWNTLYRESRCRKIVTGCLDNVPANVICLKERNLKMLKTDLILRNPLRSLGCESENIIPEGEFGAVLARAGVGKTSFAIQLALDSLLRNQNVLHVSLNDPVTKVNLWYKEVFRLLAKQYQVEQITDLWDTTLPHRFIMTFKVEGFSVPKFQERLNDLMAQDIFVPNMIIIDDLPFDDSVRASLSELKTFIRENKISAWFSVRTHRHEGTDENGMPPSLSHVADMFSVIVKLQPEKDNIFIRTLKGGGLPIDSAMLQLDPSTMLIKKLS